MLMIMAPKCPKQLAIPTGEPQKKIVKLSINISSTNCYGLIILSASLWSFKVNLPFAVPRDVFCKKVPLIV